MEVAIGVDSHKASFTAAVVDGMGRSLGDVTLPNDPQGIDALGAWMKRYPEHVIGIEGSQRYGKALAKGLEARGESVFEVPASLTGRERKRRRQRRQVRSRGRGRHRPGRGPGRGSRRGPARRRLCRPQAPLRPS